MDQSTTNFVLFIASLLINCLLGVLGYFIKSNLARTSECVNHLQTEQAKDAQNLEAWKLTYVERHAEIRARIATLEGALASTLNTMQTNVLSLLQQMPVVVNRLQTVENLLRSDKRN